MEAVRRETDNDFQKRLDWEVRSLYGALIGMFNWAASKQGHDYWSKIAAKY